MRAVHALIALGLAGGPATASALDVPVAYVRCDRTTEDFTLPGGTTLVGIDIYDVLPDVTNFFSGWNAPCDLVLREPDGTERILYDCSTDSTDAASCTAMDPAVSFDGETIAFAVFHGPLVPGSESFSVEVGGDGAFHDLPSDRLQSAEARIDHSLGREQCRHRRQ